jgi:hypothetical protein
MGDQGKVRVGVRLELYMRATAVPQARQRLLRTDKLADDNPNLHLQGRNQLEPQEEQDPERYLASII